MSQESWNRKELYEKVWSKPVVKVAEEYGVSDVAIAKVCRKLSVPVPGRGLLGEEGTWAYCNPQTTP